MATLWQKLQIVLRSAGVGLVATAVDLLSLFLLVSGLGLLPRVANLPALFGGVLVQFVGNKLFAFQDNSKQWGRQGLLFGAVEVGAIALNAFLFDRIVHLTPMPYLVARVLVTMVVYFGFSLPLWSMIFKPGGQYERAV